MRFCSVVAATTTTTTAISIAGLARGMQGPMVASVYLVTFFCFK